MRLLLFSLLLGPAAPVPQEAAPVDFVRDVRPLLEAHCLKCHGEKKPKGQFRLDSRAAALKGGISGPAIVPGRSGESLLVRLMTSNDADERMPAKAPALPPAAIQVLRRWIDEGAAWPDAAAGERAVRTHWAYVKPVRPAPPATSDRSRLRTPIDAFVLARLEQEGLGFSPEAPKEALLRRLSLDLTGLPPTPAELDAFLADSAPDAYEKRVDALLASPHYGERWARPWLDLARYADTNGFNFDSPRTMWKYRDWVIDALNRDLPYDRFTIEQIAGDLLPDATLEQRVATGFHRNTLTNEEGGVDRDEARWETLLDRVNTTATVWLGATLGCAQCHNHKYDPFTQKDYYRLLAFFEPSEEPRIELLTPEQLAERASIRKRIVEAEKALAAAELPAHVSKAISTAFEKRSNTNRNDLLTYYRAQAPAALRPQADALLALYRDHDRFDGATALVLREKPGDGPPSTLLRIRGGFETPGERVTAGTPASLHPFPAGAPQNRLGLALWLVHPDNPLVARVAVNRLWDAVFGSPLVATPEDLGTQAPEPTHPGLLDWLAAEFAALKWSQKALLRAIVTSSAYRQSSRVPPALLEKDPTNRLLSRGPRFRMEAEMVRDVVLSASGLLSPRIGGPSVYPLQADTSGVIAINKVSIPWTPSPGEDRWRRGLYTYWRRTAPFVAMAAFDAPSREVCTVKRQRTNTPLQALSGLNDPAHVEAARALARRMAAGGGAELGFRLCTARRPDARERGLLEAAFGRERKAFEADRAAAKLVAGEDDPALAAWTMLANVLLNLDETLTKE
jgi:hypothetical protein